MRYEVEVGDWEHECCGPGYERDTVVELTCLVVPGADGGPTRYVETHHELTTRHELRRIRGRVADIRIRHPGGSWDALLRLPSGKALRGYDDNDDGHLEQPTTGAMVLSDSEQYLLTIRT